MSTTTRARGVEAFEHVICTVLGLEKDSQLWESLYLNGYNTISDIATLTDDEINSLTYECVNQQGDISSKKVMMKQKKLLLHLLKWRDWISRQVNEFDVDDWLNLTSDEFNSFRVNQLPDLIRAGSSGANISSSGGPAVGGIITSSEVQLFKKSIVKSHADFPDFNGYVSKWNKTKQNYKAVAANHGISRILDDSPVPPLGSRDRELFDLQNGYFYNILKVKVKAGKAKVIVNQHAIDLDGRRAWRKFIDYYEHHIHSTLSTLLAFNIYNHFLHLISSRKEN